MKRILICILLSFFSIIISANNYYGYIVKSYDETILWHQVTIKSDAIYILTYPATIYKLHNISNIMVNGYGNKQIIATTESNDVIRIVFVQPKNTNTVVIYINDNVINVKLY